ncbi:hybrid sensor histidine kinase/response regulator [Pseudodesulfovibrio tunisiensis]|uniref:hybrid sensor histidine kinase/response regulator n=1 Tax=Pseudodesulfovibrio tunisiensis TaxID=463192 RepID=UPI001FB4AEEF|nr:response regulator [Pseudodesulfovibrio tunisiensis]
MANDTIQHPSYVALDETARALVSASIEASLVMDVGGNILAGNEAAAKMLNIKSCDDLLHVNLYRTLPENIRAERKAKFDEVAKKARPIRFEAEMNGRSLVHSVVPIANPWGEVSRVAINVLDVTDLRRTDEDLRREQQRQIFFMESLPGIVYHLYPDKTIRYANRYFRRYFGSPRGRKCEEALSCERESCLGCPPMEAMDMDRAEEWDWTDAKGRTFHLQCSPMTDSAGERMIMVLGIDITARKRAEDALQRAHDKLEDRVRQRTKELERANAELTSKSMRLVSAMKKADAATRAKSVFLANMSHEIRTPLNAVLGMAELALRATDATDRNLYLERVMQAGNSLLTVINDILDFSKIEARKLTLEAIDFNLKQTIDSAMDIHFLHAREKGLGLTADIDNAIPPVLVGDPSRLRQILINLMSNAVKFTETGGIAISARLAGQPKTPDTDEDIWLEFAVSDTGMGIPRDKQDAIFKSFLQADDSVTRKHGGTGLGLAISRQLVELMQGRMRLTSREGEGSTFSFTARFRIGDAARIPAEEAPAPSENMLPLKVLLADDNALNRQLASTLLKEQGHAVTAVENGMQALEAVQREDFDVILMDVQMPIMDGVSATRAIRDPNSGARTPDIPIVAITAHALKGDRERFLEAGMNGYISKPINTREFHRVITETTAGRTAAPAPDSDTEAGTRAESPAFDRAGALDMLGGREDLLLRMDAIFVRDVPDELRELKEHMDQGDHDEAKRLAHSIKGSSRTVGAARAGTEAEQLEYLCGQKDEKSMKRVYATLKKDVSAAVEFLKSNLEQSSQPTAKEQPHEDHTGG